MKIDWHEKVGDKTYLELLEQALKSKPYDPVQVKFPFKLEVLEKYKHYEGVVKFFEVSIGSLLLAEGEPSKENQFLAFESFTKQLKTSLEFLNKAIKNGELLE